MPLRRTFVALLLLACALPLAAPAASAEPALPNSVHLGPVADVESGLDGITQALEHELDRLGDMVAGPDPDRIVDARIATVTIECRVNEAGQRECRGMVCRGSSGEGKYPVGFGDEEYEVGVDITPNPDGSYGPYDTVRVSTGGNCGCTAWVQVPWSAIP